MNKNLLILGAGQYACVVEEIAVAMNSFEKIDFLDDNSNRAIGCLADLEKFKSFYSYGIVAIGNPSVREDLINRLAQLGFKVPVLAHPNAIVSCTAKLGKGVIVEPNATIQANSSVGDGCIVSSGSVIRHNGTLEEYCHCDCNCVVMSNSIVPKKTKLKCGEVFNA